METNRPDIVLKAFDNYLKEKVPVYQKMGYRIISFSIYIYISGKVDKKKEEAL